MRFAVVILAGLVSSTAFAGGGAASWTKATATRCGSTATMPAAPAESVETFATPKGDVTATMYMAAVGDEVFLVGCNDYATPPTLDEARDTAVANVRGTVIKEKKVKIGGHAGRQLEIQGPGASRVHARLVIVKGRLHQALVVSSTGKVPAKQVKKFLQSFRPPRGR